MLLLGALALPLASGSETPHSSANYQDDDVVAKDTEQLEALAGKLVRARKPAARDEAFKALLEQVDEGNYAEELLGDALAERWQAMTKGLVSAKLEKKFARLLKQRGELDSVRQAAVTLIEDEDRYFYPYRQPDVSAKKAAQYPKVQGEVSKLVGAVQAVWGKSLKVKLSKSAHEALEEMHWLRAQQAHAPAGLSMPESIPAWVPFVPVDVKQIDLTNFPLDAKEAARMVRDRKVTLYNERVWEERVDPKRTKSDEDKLLHARFPTEAEREQVRVTNHYRNMMGRPSVTWDPRLQESAHHHSDYQSRTGEFGHYQKDEKTRTPFDRMRLAGYPKARSENCALGATDPAGAHANWMRSSGHHRNLIMPGHKQMGSAVSGNIWTQNFGVDDGAEGDL